MDEIESQLPSLRGQRLLIYLPKIKKEIAMQWAPVLWRN